MGSTISGFVILTISGEKIRACLLNIDSDGIVVLHSAQHLDAAKDCTFEHVTPHKNIEQNFQGKFVHYFLFTHNKGPRLKLVGKNIKPSRAFQRKSYNACIWLVLYTLHQGEKFTMVILFSKRPFKIKYLMSFPHVETLCKVGL